MAGIPGKSKACKTCKKRRVKCDERKPNCKRCEKAFVVCEGYGHLRKFVNETGRFTTSSRSKIPSANSPQDESSASEVSETKSMRAGLFQFQLPKRAIKTPNLEPFHVDICLTYLTSRLFPGQGDQPPETVRIANIPWILRAMKADQTNTVYYAACCLSAAYFARMHNMTVNFEDKISHYYGTALEHLRKNLSDQRLCWSPSNIVAALLLGLYELSYVKRDTALWLLHAGGAEKLIEQRGPEAHQEDPARSYFTQSRMIIVPRALMLRRRTFLEEKDWKTLPWQKQPWKSPYNKLIDIMCDIPGLLEDSDQLEALIIPGDNDDEYSRDLDELYSNVVQILGALFRWRWNWERDFPFAVEEIPIDSDTSITVDDEKNPLFPTRLIYTNSFFEGARNIVMYDTALLYLFNIIQTWNFSDACQLATLRFSEDTPTVPTNPLILPSPDLTMESTISEVIRSIEWIVVGSRFSGAVLYLQQPLVVCMRYTSNKKLKVWMGKMGKRIARTHGIGVLQS